jgi:hypothetical protein
LRASKNLVSSRLPISAGSKADNRLALPVARPRREKKKPRARLLRAGGAGVRHDDPGGTPEVIAASTGKFQTRNNPSFGVGDLAGGIAAPTKARAEAVA